VAEQQTINCTCLCRLCGRMRRAQVHYVPGAPAAPQCCDSAMRTLVYEATVVANRLSEAKRVEWLRSGGRFVRASGRRRWKRAGRSAR
jgi:hypothetical protein